MMCNKNHPEPAEIIPYRFLSSVYSRHDDMFSVWKPGKLKVLTAGYMVVYLV